MPATSRWVERLSRVGILAKGFVYIVIGLLAVGVALDFGGVLMGSRGVLYLVGHQPLGRALLALLAFGLAAYTLWLFAQAFVDPDENGTTFVGAVNRVGQVITAIAQVVLTVEAVRLAAGRSGLVGGGLETWLGRLMRTSHGVWVIGGIGALIVVLGGLQIWRALLGDVRREWRLEALDPTEDRWKLRLGRYGLAARGLVLAGGGGLLIRAARAYDPDQAGGIAEVLATLRQESTSDWLLGVVALGLVAYGVFAFFEARYRFIPSA
jgi:hypothetical protein